MTDVTTGTLREDILNEKVMSAIVEIKVGSGADGGNHSPGAEDREEVDTVVSLGVGTRCDEQGEENDRRSHPGAAGVQDRAGQDKYGTGQNHEPGVSDSEPMEETRDDQYTPSLRQTPRASRTTTSFSPLPAMVRTTIDSLPKLKKFLELALPFKPVNIGDPVHGGALAVPAKRSAYVAIGSAT